jgi:hypothetical protein
MCASTAGTDSTGKPRYLKKGVTKGFRVKGLGHGKNGPAEPDSTFQRVYISISELFSGSSGAAN